VAASFSKLLCKPSREETEVVDAGQRAGELSKQAIKIFQQIANDGSSQYLYLFVASSAVFREVAAGFSKILCRPSGEETEVVAFGKAWLRVGQGSLAGTGRSWSLLDPL
jgi:hypothetical protein